MLTKDCNAPAPEGISLPKYMGLYTDGEGSQIFGVLTDEDHPPVRYVSYLEYPPGMPQTHPIDIPSPKVWRYAMEFDAVPDKEIFQQKLAEYEPKFRAYLKAEAEREHLARQAKPDA